MLYIATIWHNCISANPRGYKLGLSVAPAELSAVSSRCELDSSCSWVTAGLALEQIPACQYWTCDAEASISGRADTCSLFVCIYLNYGLKSFKRAIILFEWDYWAHFLTFVILSLLTHEQGFASQVSRETAWGLWELRYKKFNKDNKLHVDENTLCWAT